MERKSKTQAEATQAANENGETLAGPVESPPAKKPRKVREKTAYLLEQRVVGDRGNGTWDAGDGKPFTFDSVLAAREYVKTNNLTGAFRVVAVKDSFSAEKVEQIAFK